MSVLILKSFFTGKYGQLQPSCSLYIKLKTGYLTLITVLDISRLFSNISHKVSILHKPLSTFHNHVDGFRYMGLGPFSGYANQAKWSKYPNH